MYETRTIEGIRLSLIHVKNLTLFADRMARQSEFDGNSSAGRDIGSLQQSLQYSERLLKQLYLKATAHALKKDRILSEKKDRRSDVQLACRLKKNVQP